MSHTWEYGKTVFIGNSDLSGDITIRRDDHEIDIPGAHILKFVADHIMRERIAVQEQMTASEILGFRIPDDMDKALRRYEDEDFVGSGRDRS